ncbi:rRNA biogenesis protein RRP5-like [Euphorbia lathyris]|uniref:rRNA biogenesis protein RRP5-like n=1 Tax=Euphorbia lathyris TaxID=212925 RepID=UPI003313E920
MASVVHLFTFQQQHVNIGDIYDSAKVARLDKGMCLLLEIPYDPVSTPTYVSISDVDENEVHKFTFEFLVTGIWKGLLLGF